MGFNHMDESKSSTFQITKIVMPKLFTSLVTVQFACNNHEANSKEDYIDLLKRQYLEFYNIDLQDYEITEIEEIKND